MTHQYILTQRAHPTLADARAAVELIKDLGGKSVGPFITPFVTGLVYDLPRALTQTERQVIGVIEFR